MFQLTEIEDLLKDVEILRDKLLELINEKNGDLLDAEVISASKILNAALNEYNKFIEKKFRKA